MPNPEHTSLWPLSLKTDQGFDFKAFLRVQAEDLKRLVNDAFDVEIKTHIVENLFIHDFIIVVPRLNYRYQLFSVRLLNGEFPARLVAPHLPEPRQIVPVSGKEELEQALRLLFHDPATTKIVLALADEGRGPGGEAREAAQG